MREGFLFEIKTSARNLISSLRNDPTWRTASYCFAKDSKHQIEVKKIKSRNDVKAATFVRNDVMGRWNFYDYHPTSKPSGGRINHSQSIRTDCKVATFRSVTNNG